VRCTPSAGAENPGLLHDGLDGSYGLVTEAAWPSSSAPDGLEADGYAGPSRRRCHPLAIGRLPTGAPAPRFRPGSLVTR
jgi:peptidoglycan hydrolase-like protein with peptidoglycan-binding domain